MKKDDLKASLGRIRPREELIDATLVKMRAQKEREERRSAFFTPAYAKGLRLAGALCAFALVFCIGFVVARQSALDPDTGSKLQDARLAGEIDTNETMGADVAMFTLDDGQEWTVVRGKVSYFNFEELTEADLASGVLHRASVVFHVSEIEKSSDTLSRDTISTTIETEILFYDSDSMNAFVNEMWNDMLFKLVPAGEDDWEIEDFSAVE